MKKTIHDSDYKNVLALVRSFRENKGITQAQLAKKLGFDQTFISKIETGERRMDVIELRRICLALDIDFIFFIKQMEKLIKK